DPRTAAHRLHPDADRRRPVLADADQGRHRLRRADGRHAVHDLVRAPGRGPHAAAPGTELERAVRPAPVAGRRAQARVQGGHPPGPRRQGGVLHRPGAVGGAGVRGLVGDPARTRGVHLRRAHRPAAHRPARRRPGRSGLLVDRRLRHRARRLGVGLAVPAARQPAQRRPGHLLRAGAGPVDHRGGALRGLAVHRRHRRRAADRLVHLAAAGELRDLRGVDGRRDQPRAVRPPRGRVRAGRRLPHRVLVAEVRAVLPRRVRQHGHPLRGGHHAVPRRLDGALAAVADPGGQRGLAAARVVPGQDARVPVRLRLAARHAAPPALRPVHAPGLEAAHPDQPPVADARRDPAGAARRADHRPDPRRRRGGAGRARRGGAAAARPGTARGRPRAPGRRRLPRPAAGPRGADDTEAAPPRGGAGGPGRARRRRDRGRRSRPRRRLL
ncbi:MAG: NADH-ubiquinone oxidoreductase chain H, partial [uncultured Actinomycetospora sp.]